MKLLVMGYARHGKDTFCEYLEAQYGLTFTSSSLFACKLFLFDQLKERYDYATVEECFNDRYDKRELWYEAICEYNKGDLTRLGTALFAEHDVYCGLRDKGELEAIKASGLFDLSIWVDASYRLPPEPASSISVTREDADLVITNNDSLAGFKAKIDLFAKYMKLGK